MNTFDYRVVRESWERANDARRYNRGLVLTWRHKGQSYVAPIGAGDSDEIHAFVEGNEVYVVTINHSLDYTGLEAFTMEHAEKSKYSQSLEAIELEGSVFLQGSEQIEEYLGNRGLNLSPRTIAKKLAAYVS